MSDDDCQDMYVDMTKPHPTCGDEEGEERPADMHETTFSLDQHATSKATEAEDGKPAIDSKPMVRPETTFSLSYSYVFTFLRSESGTHQEESLRYFSKHFITKKSNLHFIEFILTKSFV